MKKTAKKISILALSLFMGFAPFAHATNTTFTSFVTGLSAKTTPSNTDLLYVNDGADKSITWSNAKSALNIALGTTTTVINIDGNRTDGYLADGSVFRPATTTAQAISLTSSNYGSVLYQFAPATYVETSPLNFTANFVTIIGNGSVIVPVAGMSITKGYLMRNVTISGDVTVSDASASSLHASESVIISGNLIARGAPTTHTYTGGIVTNGNIYVATGTSFAATGVFASSTIFNSGQLLWNGSQLNTTNYTYYAINATSSQSRLVGFGDIINNFGTGGGVNCQNSATSSPNEFGPADVNVGVGTPTDKGVNCGAALSSLVNLNINDMAGKQYYQVSSAPSAFISSISNTTGSSTAAYFVATSTATSTFGGPIVSRNSTSAGTLILGNSTQTASTTIVADAITTGTVGIGTTSPGTVLSVGGTSGINFTTGTTTSSATGGFNILAGCYAVGGSCISGGAGGGGTPFPFTPFAGYNGTTTAVGFLNGMFSNASTTFNATTTFNRTAVTSEYMYGYRTNVATSTNMAVDWGLGNSQLINISTSAVTLNMTDYFPGQKLDLTVCNPKSGTAGTITWDSAILWPGGVQVGQTTTANNCDIWSFSAGVGTSTALTGTPSTRIFFRGQAASY